jgi:hypothetical protein
MQTKGDAAYHERTLGVAMESLLSGNFESGKKQLRAFVNSTIGFTTLSDLTHLPPKSLMRMLGPSGNPES